ncbi:MAG: PepSY domain-containing protein [Candidatus Nanopelagicales bacterium]
MSAPRPHQNRTARRAGIAVTTLALTLGLAGCGGNDAETPVATATVTETAPAETPAATETAATDAATPAGAATAEQAAATALATIDGSQLVEIGRDTDDGQDIWEVLVRAEDGTGIEVYVDANTNSVLRQSPESLPSEVANGMPAVRAEDAMATALAAKPGAVTDVDLDTEAGAVVWTVVVREASGVSTEFYIDATSGEIVKQEIDD